MAKKYPCPLSLTVERQPQQQEQAAVEQLHILLKTIQADEYARWRCAVLETISTLKIVYNLQWVTGSGASHVWVHRINETEPVKDRLLIIEEGEPTATSF